MQIEKELIEYTSEPGYKICRYIAYYCQRCGLASGTARWLQIRCDRFDLRLKRIAFDTCVG